MFKKVRLQLTLINIAVVGIILLLFFSGIYILMKQQITRQSDQLMHAVAGENRFRPPNRLPLQEKHWANCFYVRIDASGKITDKSTDPPVSDAELLTLLQKSKEISNDFGDIKIAADTYRFLKTKPPNETGTTFVFMSTQPENETLGRLKAILISTGLAGLIMVFVCSLFLADRALIPIKKAWDRQKNFTADASHELRSPLAVIQTNLELVMGNPEETVESQTKWLENMLTENKRMTKLVTDLLLLARADSDQQMIEKRQFSLSDILRDAAEVYIPVATRKEIELESRLEEDIIFFGDEARIKQLVIILLDNAIKYTLQGGLVKLGLRSHDSHVEISVADTGEGISEEHLDRIFERFYRVDKARSRESGGTGLGLSIANWIVKEHRGTISVSSALGNGSTFKVSLPKMLTKNR